MGPFSPRPTYRLPGEYSWSSAALVALTRHGLARARQWLTARRSATGEWVVPCPGGMGRIADSMLLVAWRGRGETEDLGGGVAALRHNELASGGWGDNGRFDLDTSLRAYLALRCAGLNSDAPILTRAANAIREAGGVECAGTLTRYQLALFGWVDFDDCPPLPPELLFLPRSLSGLLERADLAAHPWLVALSVVWGRRPVRGAQELRVIDEGLRPVSAAARDATRVGRRAARGRGTGWGEWLGQRWRGCAWRWLRPLSLQWAANWLVDHLPGSDGLAADFDATWWALIALESLGYPSDGPEVQQCEEHLARRVRDAVGMWTSDGDSGDVHDTIIAARALSEVPGGSDQQGLDATANWLLGREGTRRVAGVNAALEPSGWHPQRRNAFYPDVTTTSGVLSLFTRRLGSMALSLSERERAAAWRIWSGGGGAARVPVLGLDDVGDAAQAGFASVHFRRFASVGDASRGWGQVDPLATACRRAFEWILARQNADGGWGRLSGQVTADGDDTWWRTELPGGTRSDPGVTGEVLEALGPWEAAGTNFVERALEYLDQQQTPRGNWSDGRGGWEVVSTARVLVGLYRVGVVADDSLVARGIRWLAEQQGSAGGWRLGTRDQASGVASRDLWPLSLPAWTEERARERADSSPDDSVVATAWAIRALLPYLGRESPVVLRGVQWLLERQRSDGNWDDPTGRGLVGGGASYWRSPLDSVARATLALAEWLMAR